MNPAGRPGEPGDKRKGPCRPRVLGWGWRFAFQLDGCPLLQYSSGMPLAHSRLTAQGQISVPAEVRRRLGVGPGSILEWEQQGAAIVVRRAGRYTSEDLHQALFKAPPKRKSLRELKEGIRRHMRRRHAGR